MESPFCHMKNTVILQIESRHPTSYAVLTGVVRQIIAYTACLFLLPSVYRCCFLITSVQITAALQSDLLATTVREPRRKPANDWLDVWRLTPVQRSPSQLSAALLMMKAVPWGRYRESWEVSRRLDRWWRWLCLLRVWFPSCDRPVS